MSVIKDATVISNCSGHNPNDVNTLLQSTNNNNNVHCVSLIGLYMPNAKSDMETTVPETATATAATITKTIIATTASTTEALETIATAAATAAVASTTTTTTSPTSNGKTASYRHDSGTAEANNLPEGVRVLRNVASNVESISDSIATAEEIKKLKHVQGRSNSTGRLYNSSRRVSFPENDSELVTGYLEPADPWACGMCV